MKRTFKFPYVIHNVIPYRCRKPRTIHYQDGLVEVEVRELELTTEQFPVAIMRNRTWRDEQPEKYYWFEEKLWVAHYPNWSGWKGTPLEIRAHFDQYAGPSFQFWQTKEENLASAEVWTSNHLIVNGLVYRTAKEPTYCVHTFGLGYNHGGTAVMIESGYNGNISWTRYFRADEFDKAAALALEIATNRGDSESLKTIPKDNDLVVLIPEAIRANPLKDYGGPGDDFLNRLDVITSSAESAAEAAVLGMMAVFAL